MTDLEDGGEAVLGITGTWHTLHASGVEWRHHARLLEAFEIGTTPPPGSSGESVRISSSSGSPGPDEGNQPWSIWIERPTLKRAEFMVGDESVIVIFHGHTWWSWSPLAGGARQYREDPRHTRTRTIDWLVGDATALSLVTSEGTLARHDAWARRDSPPRITSGDDHRTRSFSDDASAAPHRVGRRRIPFCSRRPTGSAAPLRGATREPAISRPRNDRGPLR